jgi:hypothetical protein
MMYFSESFGAHTGPGPSKMFFSKIVLNITPLDAELHSISEFHIEVKKEINANRGKSNLI